VRIPVQENVRTILQPVTPFSIAGFKEDVLNFLENVIELNHYLFPRHSSRRLGAT